MQKKLIGLFSLLIVASIILAACGGAPANNTDNVENMENNTMNNADTAEANTAEENTANEEANAGEEDTAEEDTGPIATITIWADDTRSVTLLPLADAFYEAYQVEVIVEEVASIRDQVIVAAPAGEGPDIFIGAHDWLGELYASGLVAPLDLGDTLGEFSDAAVQGCTYEGEIYCMPYATENIAFFYNTDLVETAPTTWEEVIAMGQALKDADSVDYAIALSGTTYDAYPLFTALGGYVFGRDDAGNYNPEDVGIDNEGMVAAGEWIAAGIEAGLISDSVDWDTAHVLFENGQTAFLMAGPWALDRIRASEIPYAVTTFPNEGAPFMGVQGFFVNAFSENTLLAQAFLTEFVATEEIMTELQIAGGRPSAFPAVSAASDDADFPAFAAAGANAQPMPAIPEMGSVWGAWGDAISLVVNGEETAAAALANGAEQIRGLIAGVNPNLGMVNAPGSWQASASIDCGEWSPSCADSALTEGDDGLFSGTFSIAAGEYEVKIALDGGWDTNYGVDGVAGGDNYPLVLDADSTVTFTYDPATNLLTIDVE